MKKIIKIEIEIDDAYVEEWNENFLKYHTGLYQDEEKARRALEENPIEKLIASKIEDYIENNHEGLIFCNTYIEGS